MEAAFKTRDSLLLEETLDDEFECLGAVDDADTLRDVLGDIAFCRKASYLVRMGQLFRDSTVAWVTLNLFLYDEQEYLGDDCIECKQVEATATLRVHTVADGCDPSVLALDTPMTFVAVRDPHEPTSWLLRKQISRPRSGASAFGAELAGWLDCDCNEGGTTR